MDRIRIAVIGLGWFGEIHCVAVVGIPKSGTCRALHAHAGRLKAIAAKFGVKKTTPDYRDLLADPDIDAVSIVTMWDQHTEPAVAALEAGKHVFLEKPMASTVEDCRKIMAAATRSRGFSRGSATSAASTRATAWPSRRSPSAKLARSSR